MRSSTAAVLLVAGFGIAAQYLFYREALGLNVLAATALFLAIAWSVRSARPTTRDLWMPAFAMAFAAFLAVRTDTALVAFDVLALVTLTLATTASLRGVEVARLPFATLLFEALRTGTDALWRAIPLASARARPLARSSPTAARALPYVGGVVLALPLIFVFAALFRAADPVFARAWDQVLDLEHWWTWLGDARGRGLIALGAAWIAAGALAPRGAPPRLGTRVSGRSDVLTAFLASLVVVFAAFVAVQVAYLFGGADTMAAASLSYSEYARRGFFELLFVAGLVAATLFAVEMTAVHATRAYLASALSLVALSGVVVASSLYRIDLYQRAYGWSELRLYALAAIAAVGIALAVLAWSIVTRRTSFAVQPIVFAAFAIALVVNASAPAGFIARENLLRPATPEVRRPDVWYVASLGAGALPQIVAIRDRLSEEDRRCLDFALVHLRRANAWRSSSWQSWNLDRQRAADALAWLEENAFPKVDPTDPRPCRG